MSTALITGATAGIGNSFARMLAQQGYDLVLVARDEGRLRALAESLHHKYGIHVEPFRADLSRYDECAWVEERLADPARPVDVLINNAGFGVKQHFAKGDLLVEQGMFDVLVRAVMRLSHVAGRAMSSRGQGTIINVASVAAWRNDSSYAAAKSYVLKLSRAMHQQLMGSGVRVSALCPGFTETEFHQRADMQGLRKRFPDFLWLNADQVAIEAWRDAQRGRAVSVPGGWYRAIRWLLKPFA